MFRHRQGLPRFRSLPRVEVRLRLERPLAGEAHGFHVGFEDLGGVAELGHWPSLAFVAARFPLRSGH